MNIELKQYLQMRADQRIAELTSQEIDEVQSFNFDEAIDCIKKKCNLYDLKSVVLNLKTTN